MLPELRATIRQVWHTRLLWCGCLLLCFSASAWGSEFALRTFPVPAGVDGQETPSGIYLQCKVKEYNLPLDAFKVQAKELREQLFIQAVEALRSNDLPAFSKLWGPVRPAPTVAGPKNAKPVVLGPTDVTPQGDLTAYRANFGNFASMKIVSQVLAGSRSIFIWEADSKMGHLRTDFVVGTTASGQPRVGASDSETDPGDYLIIFTMLEMGDDPANFKAVPDPKLPYHYALPLDGRGNPGKDAVYLEFDGERVNFDVFNPSAVAPDPVLDSYRTAYLAFKNRNLDEFESMHTPKSATKLKKSFSGMTKPVFDQYYNMYTAPRYVKFVIKADPIYLLFYSSHKGNDWTPGKLPYEYVVRDTTSGSYKLTNVSYQDFLDYVLMNRDLFDQVLFKPPAQK